MESFFVASVSNNLRLFFSICLASYSLGKMTLICWGNLEWGFPKRKNVIGVAFELTAFKTLATIVLSCAVFSLEVPLISTAPRIMICLLHFIRSMASLVILSINTGD